MVHTIEFQENNLTSGRMNLVFRSRIIWRDIATWMGAYLVSTYLDADTELRQRVKEKLDNVPLEYGIILRIFFGDQAADEYIALFSNYIMLLESVIDAHKRGDANAVNEYTKQLYENVDQRINYLTQINPFWQKEILRSLIYNFTNMTLDEVNTFLSKDYRRNVNLFERKLSHTTVMGDYLAKGLFNYFTFSSRQPGIQEE